MFHLLSVPLIPCGHPPVLFCCLFKTFSYGASHHEAHALNSLFGIILHVAVKPLKENPYYSVLIKCHQDVYILFGYIKSLRLLLEQILM